MAGNIDLTAAMTSARNTTGSIWICCPDWTAGETEGTGVLGVALSPWWEATGIAGEEEPGKLKRREWRPLVVVIPLMLEIGATCGAAAETFAN